MRSLEQILYDNGPGIGLPMDNTPALDTHNGTGRVIPDRCTGAWDIFTFTIQHDGDTCPIHEL